MVLTPALGCRVLYMYTISNLFIVIFGIFPVEYTGNKKRFVLNSPGKFNTGAGSHSLLGGIFPTQGSNPGLLHCTQILYCLGHQGSPHYVTGLFCFFL